MRIDFGSHVVDHAVADLGEEGALVIARGGHAFRAQLFARDARLPRFELVAVAGRRIPDGTLIRVNGVDDQCGRGAKNWRDLVALYTH